MAQDEERDTPEAGEKENRTAFVKKVNIDVNEKGILRIVLDKASVAELFDQGPEMLKGAGQGCMSAPGGPSC